MDSSRATKYYKWMRAVRVPGLRTILQYIRKTDLFVEVIENKFCLRSDIIKGN